MISAIMWLWVFPPIEVSFDDIGNVGFRRETGLR
jgi:hypothetical protein